MTMGNWTVMRSQSRSDTPARQRRLAVTCEPDALGDGPNDAMGTVKEAAGAFGWEASVTWSVLGQDGMPYRQTYSILTKKRPFASESQAMSWCDTQMVGEPTPRGTHRQVD